MRPKRVIYNDTETHLDKISETETEHSLWFGFANYVDYDHNNRDDTLLYRDSETFWSWVDSKVVPSHPVYILHHNSDYDFRILEGFTHLRKLGYYLKLCITDSCRWIVEFSTNPKERESQKEQIKSKEKYKKIIVLDTLNWFKASLKKLGEMSGIPKLDMPSHKNYGVEWEMYCRRDVVVLRKVFEDYIGFLDKNNMGPFGYTIASQAFKTYKYRFMDKPIYIHGDEATTELERASYYGGRVECFRIGNFNSELYYKLDINSMYPYCMKEFVYPIKHKMTKTVIDKKTRQEMNLKYPRIARIKVKTKRACIPYRDPKKHRLLFPIGEFETTLCQPELDLLDKYNIQYEEIRTAWYECADLFSSYVDMFYKLRQEFKSEKNDIYQYFCKILMNSLYGKFGQRVDKWEIYQYVQSRENWSKSIIDLETGKVEKYKRIAGQDMRCVGVEESYDSFAAIAAFVTSYARALLWEYIEIAGRRNVYYCDTDSLFVNSVGLSNLEKIVDESQLGLLKIEDKSTLLQIRNLKDYRFGDEDKIKGVGKGDVKPSDDEIEQYLKDHKIKNKSNADIRDNMYMTEQWEHLSGALKKEQPETVITRKVIKRMARDYQKGVVREDGEVIPYELGLQGSLFG